ncbi:formylglycine-generating enzyme family protein [Cellulomonas fimi]|uniref:Formylglycine-generating enzyme family protein n=1 Tax=Cellulomonas fimi TaxID=1708 RepID=A0A7Y0QFG9_CELFI|nr:formylglycine-generating enzyme family protein [Cellulomonas fimi]
MAQDTSGPYGACCTPARSSTDSEAVPPGDRHPTSRAKHAIGQVRVPAGEFWMGDHHGDGMAADGEVPVHRVDLQTFTIDATTVTNAAFAGFVEDTGYVTEAERFGDSAVFHLALAADPDDVLGRAASTPWWLAVRGADWRHPEGRRSSLEGRDDHPVVHVSWNDAQAYCAWAGRRLPTEAEWEYASRGGLGAARYPWGDELHPPGASTWRCNIWQGRFPVVNAGDDGFLTTAPVRAYQPNGFGLWQTVGNVWEWCSDWFSPTYYGSSPSAAPQGPAHGTARVMRGGSFLCHDSYCNRYRNAARSSNTPDSSMANGGFRTVSR